MQPTMCGAIPADRDSPATTAMRRSRENLHCPLGVRPRGKKPVAGETLDVITRALQKLCRSGAREDRWIRFDDAHFRHSPCTYVNWL